MKYFQIYSEYDGWYIQYLENNKVIEQWAWDHDDVELGCGGEEVFGDILEFLGHTVYEEGGY